MKSCFHLFYLVHNLSLLYNLIYSTDIFWKWWCLKWVAKVFPMFFVRLLGFCFSVIKERTIKVFFFFIWSFIPNLLEVIFNYSVQSEPLHGELKLSEGSARPRECQAAKPRDARNEGGRRKRPSLAFRIIPLVIFVCRAFRLTDQEKRERLFVV